MNDIVAERIGRAIAALGAPEFPAAYAELLGCVCDFDNFVVLAYRGDAQPITLYRASADPVVFAFLDSEYVAAAYLLDPFYEAHLRREQPGFYALRDIAPDQFARTSYFRVYYEKTTLIDEIAAIFYTDTGYTITACLGVDRGSGKPFPRRALAELRRLKPVAIALAEKHWHDFSPDAPGRARAAPPLHERLIDAIKRRREVSLTRRQAEVAMLILQGHSSQSIGLALGVSPQTVKVFRKQLYARIGVCSQAELFALMMPLLAEATGGDAAALTTSGSGRG